MTEDHHFAAHHSQLWHEFSSLSLRSSTVERNHYIPQQGLGYIYPYPFGKELTYNSETDPLD